MLVKNIYNELAQVPEHMGLSTGLNDKSALIPNKHYVVYGMTIRDDHMWYYICDENYTHYPVCHPAPAFEVIGDQLSRYWVYSCREDFDYRSVIAFPEWSENPQNYYDRLIEGNEQEIEIFLKYKKLLDLEFPNPTISTTSYIRDEEWLVCPSCINVWRSLVKYDALVVCPKCNTVMNNPRYHINDPFQTTL